MIDRLVETQLAQPHQSDDSVALAGHYKTIPEDFIVHEDLGFELNQAGEHLYLHLEKVRLTTIELATHLARVYKVSLRDVGYSGMKDKQAVARQWFSILTPEYDGYRAEWCSTERSSEVRLIKAGRHGKKLRLGSHRANRFSIVIRNISSNEIDSEQAIRSSVQRRLQKVQLQGFPNYFGSQRFGIEGRNIRRAIAHLKNPTRKIQRKQRSIYLSALRSALFNHVLSCRIKRGAWLDPLEGEPLMLSGSRSFFVNGADENPVEIKRRIEQGDISTSGPLVGSGREDLMDAHAKFELAALEPYAALCAALREAGMRSDRRALRALATEIDSQWMEHNSLKVSVELAPGSYATMLIKAIAHGFSEQRG